MKVAERPGLALLCGLPFNQSKQQQAEVCTHLQELKALLDSGGAATKPQPSPGRWWRVFVGVADNQELTAQELREHLQERLSQEHMPAK